VAGAALVNGPRARKLRLRDCGCEGARVLKANYGLVCGRVHDVSAAIQFCAALALLVLEENV